MEIGFGLKIKKYNEIVLLHLIGAIMILICHFTQKEHISSLGELFISGVPLFLFVSGFLSGLKLDVDRKWLIKRFIRILIPYFIWVIPCLLILWIADRKLVSLNQILFLLTNMQGVNYIYWKSELYSGVVGLGHLWFVTEIILCYLLVPIFNKITSSNWKRKSWYIIMGIIILLIQPLLMEVGIQISYIITFFVGFLTAKYGANITNRLIVNVTIGMLMVTIMRFVLMYYIDGSNYYDRYFSLISAASIGIWIFWFVFWVSFKRPSFLKKMSNNKSVIFLSEISFEIYLVHYWFLDGKWQVSNYISNVIVSDFIVIILTVIFATILHLISQKIVKYLNHRLEVL